MYQKSELRGDSPVSIIGAGNARADDGNGGIPAQI